MLLQFYTISFNKVCYWRRGEKSIVKWREKLWANPLLILDFRIKKPEYTVHCHLTYLFINLHPSVSPAPLCPLPLQTSSVPAHPYHTAPSDVYQRSSKEPCSYSSEHNQFLLQWSTMRPLQPLTPPSILPLLTAAAAAGCATQMGLCSAMKWARFVRVHVCCIYCACVCVCEKHINGRWRWWQCVIYSGGPHMRVTTRQTSVVSHFSLSNWRSLCCLVVSITHNATKG